MRQKLFIKVRYFISMMLTVDYCARAFNLGVFKCLSIDKQYQYLILVIMMQNILIRDS